MQLIIEEKRKDMDFFELIPMSKLKPETSKSILFQELISVNAPSVTGKVSNDDGEYLYYLKHYLFEEKLYLPLIFLI